jgi:hypothetical protein
LKRNATSGGLLAPFWRLLDIEMTLSGRIYAQILAQDQCFFFLDQADSILKRDLGLFRLWRVLIDVIVSCFLSLSLSLSLSLEPAILIVPE